MAESTASIPFIDPNIEYVGIRKLRYMNGQALRELRSVIVLQGTGSEPLAVVIPYRQYMAMQKIILEGWLGIVHSLPGVEA